MKRSRMYLYAVGYDPDARRVLPAVRLTREPGSDLHPVVLRHPTDGQLYVVWQGWRDGDFDILLKPVKLDPGGDVEREQPVWDSPANEMYDGSVTTAQRSAESHTGCCGASFIDTRS